MKTLSTLTAAAAIALALFATGCAENDPCVGDACAPDGPGTAESVTPTSAPLPNIDFQIDCHRVCNVLVGTCEVDGPLTNDERMALRGCNQSCLEGQFPAGEIECLLTLGCGDSPLPCFE